MNVHQPISPWREGYSLPQEFYISQAIFDEDVRQLGQTQWLLVDHESRIPQQGNYFLFELGSESVIVIRNRSGEVKAFYNVCRHRGSRICLENEGSKRVLTCPYHAWSYDLDGNLRSANLMPADFDPKEVKLAPVHIGIFEGFIFLNFADGTPPDFDAFVAPFRDLLRGHGLKKTKVAVRKTYPTAANWKLVVENFFECYHCNSAHPTYCSVHDKLKMLAFGAGAGSGDDKDMKLYEEKLANWERFSSGLGYPVGMFADEANSAFFQSGNRLPIADNAKTESVDGNPLAPLMNEFSDFDGGQTGCVLNPLSTLLVNNDHAIFFHFIPKGPRSTDVEAVWLVGEDAVEGADYDPANLMKVWDVTLTEDKTITENNQLGVNSRQYRSGRYSTQERRIAEFVQWYLDKIAP
ncbi:aromatic ring-hydroxylating dioxygenase subunit alpha [Rhizobium lentis]|uniref:aromatic ring-hydroxylating oxygenase subunit alpha n=1 Tax=Rhizobium lentis TaxID=1138194 RepID=UPI001C83219E|nr:aromatic ring-hydroxylating dioxygenase subunit alpha [Rhizobium lentis]MBX5179001.1 aromatic ring-hydroxylating dioxygenase subunit alpha [Rhizobium lentis]